MKLAFRVVITMSTAILLAGCAGSLLSGAGPSINAIKQSSDEIAYQVLDISAATIGEYSRPKEAPPLITVSATTMKDPRLVPGDVLKIMIADSSGEGAIFAPLASGGTVFSSVRLDENGDISLPYAGKQRLGGLTPTEVEVALRRSLRGLATDPQVHVELIGDLSGSVLVAGAVKTPGRFSALQGPLTLLDAINRAGGPILEPHLTRVVIRTGTDVRSLNYEDLLGGQNQLVSPNSEIIVERARKRFVAMGALNDPGLHDLPSNRPSLLEVLGVVGGLKEASADASGIFIFRLTEIADEQGIISPRAQVFRLNMKDPAAVFLARQFLVLPEDAVYVTNAAVYEWQKIISPIVQVLVLGRTLHNGI